MIHHGCDRQLTNYKEIIEDKIIEFMTIVYIVCKKSRGKNYCIIHKVDCFVKIFNRLCSEVCWVASKQKI